MTAVNFPNNPQPGDTFLSYANESTDYFEIYVQQTSTANRTTTAGTTISYFSGCMIRGA